MPIDDIEYLQQNSVKEHVMVLIDSDNRDKRRWKSPNEFAINFPEPFTNVIGVEILNALIPRTSFMVDEHCNKIAYRFGYNSFITTESVVELTNRNYYLVDKLFDNITRKLSDSIEINADIDQLDEENIVFSTENDEIIDDLMRNRPIMKLKSSVPFLFDMEESSSKYILGFDEFTDVEEMNTSMKQRYIPLSLILLNDSINYISSQSHDQTIHLPDYDHPMIDTLDNILFYKDNRNFETNFKLTTTDGIQKYYIKNIKLKYYNNTLINETRTSINFTPNDIELFAPNYNHTYSLDKTLIPNHDSLDFIHWKKIIVTNKINMENMKDKYRIYI